MTCKKVLRAQRIAMENRLPLIYLVDSAGVFLPLQDEVFPDEDDFGRIFRNNAVISAAGIPQFAAIMGNCVAGGGYLPGHVRHAADDRRQRPVPCGAGAGEGRHRADVSSTKTSAVRRCTPRSAARSTFARSRRGKCASSVCGGWSTALPAIRESVEDSDQPARRLQTNRLAPPKGEYDVRDLLKHVPRRRPHSTNTRPSTARRSSAASAGSAACRSASSPTSGSACKPAEGPLQFGGVIYVDSADKAARFIMDCNQTRMPILFLQDVNGFMVGRDSEQAGIIRAGAKLVNAIANSVVPKITLITGGSFGAGNYALVRQGVRPAIHLRLADGPVRGHGRGPGGEHAARDQVQALKRAGKEPDAAELKELRDKVKASYDEQTDIRYAAARLWVDAIIQPENTRPRC